MSIVTSREERQEAAADLADKPKAQLLEDLAFWSIAVVDHRASFDRLTEQRALVSDQYLEAETWVRLIADELRARRRPISRSLPIEP